MNVSTKIWLTYSVFGLILSIAITALFDAVPSIKFLSDEGVVFGIMFSIMGAALKNLSGKLPEVNPK